VPKLDFFTNILEQFGAVFQLQERLSSLSSSNPVAAIALIFVITVVGANTVFTQFVEFRKKFFGEWVHSAVAWVALAVVASVAVLISTGVVLNLRKAAAPIPVLLLDSDAVIGRPLLLSWKYDNPEDRFVQFEVQSSKDKRFQELSEHGYRSGHATLIGSINSKLYWRVRAVGGKHVPISNWSLPVRITQYDNSLARISDTRSVNVYVSNSLNQGFFEFESDDGTLKGYDLAVIDYIVSGLAVQLHIDGPITFNPVTVDWQDLLVAPKNGRADIIISAITSLSEREDTLSIKFSKPYYCTTQSVIFRPVPLTKPITQMIENKRVGVINKTTSEDLIQKFSGKFNVRHYDEGAEMIADIAKGEIDLGLTDTPFARGAELQYGTQALNFKELVNNEDFPKGIDRERRVEKYAIAVRAGEEQLIGAINRIIDEMREEKLAELLEQATEEFYKVKPSSRDASIDRRKDPSLCPSN
jgi:ABC-type amino acid transport substrate-binding protein